MFGAQTNGIATEHDAVTDVHMMTGLHQLWYTPQTASEGMWPGTAAGRGQ